MASWQDRIFAVNWSSFGFRPELWDWGIAKHLLTSTMDLFDRWGIREAGLFTFPNSPKHIRPLPEIRLLSPFSHRLMSNMT